MENEHCHCTAEHAELKGRTMPDDNVIYGVSELFKVFGDVTRIKILFLLLKEEMCVCDIAGLLGMQQSAISHQLRVLKQARLVKFRRDGKTVFYSLADGHVETMLSQGIEHAEE
jgi:ArsR family transcriptional regulator